MQRYVKFAKMNVLEIKNSINLEVIAITQVNIEY